MDRISPATLRLVLLALGVCAVVGIWMGLRDSLGREAPEWESGRATVPAVAAGPPEAVAIDAKEAARDYSTPPPAQVPVSRPAPRPEVAETETPPAETVIAPPPLTVPPVEKAAAEKAAQPKTAPPAKAPPAKAPATKTAPKPASDPIGDLVQEKTKAPPPPEVPF